MVIILKAIGQMISELIQIQIMNQFQEGQGSYFFNLKNQVFVGEWVEDIPKTGVYSGVDDPDNPKADREQNYHQAYILPPFPQIKLSDPTGVLQQAMEKVRQERTFYRASYIPINELYEEDQLNDLLKEFSSAENELHLINMINLQAILANLNFELVEEEIESYLSKLNSNYHPDEIDFELFARLIAILLEEVNNLQRPEPSEKNEKQQFSQEHEKYFEESDSYFEKLDQQLHSHQTEQNEIEAKMEEENEEENDHKQQFGEEEEEEEEELDESNEQD